MTRTEIINALIKKYGYKSYLEIGVCDPRANFNRIECEYKVGVDPDPNSKATHCMTSDTFFRNLNSAGRYDVILVDGLHEAYQVYKDIVHGLAQLSFGGTVVCHDMNPPNEACQKVPRETVQWTGDCWKAWVRLRQEKEGLSMCVVDSDWGVGVIQRGSQTKLSNTLELTYENLCKNRQKWLNLISVNEFLAWVE